MTTTQITRTNRFGGYDYLDADGMLLARTENDDGTTIVHAFNGQPDEHLLWTVKLWWAPIVVVGATIDMAVNAVRSMKAIKAVCWYCRQPLRPNWDNEDFPFSCDCPEWQANEVNG
jgi:hypothetical protein